MPIPSTISFETILPLVVSGDITAKEIQSIPLSTISLPERQALLIALADVAREAADGAGGTWGGSLTLPEAKKPIHGTFTGTAPSGLELVIPASIWYSVYLVSDGTITEANGSTLTTDGEGDGYFYAQKRADGQAYPSVTYTVPDTLVVKYSYLPL